MVCGIWAYAGVIYSTQSLQSYNYFLKGPVHLTGFTMDMMNYTVKWKIVIKVGVHVGGIKFALQILTAWEEITRVVLIHRSNKTLQINKQNCFNGLVGRSVNELRIHPIQNCNLFFAQPASLTGGGRKGKSEIEGENTLTPSHWLLPTPIQLSWFAEQSQISVTGANWPDA